MKGKLNNSKQQEDLQFIQQLLNQPQFKFAIKVSLCVCLLPVLCVNLLLNTLWALNNENHNQQTSVLLDFEISRFQRRNFHLNFCQS